MRRSRLCWTILLCASICSGAAALALEVVWSKALVVPLGNSADSTALVLAGFMLGMAAGAWLGAWVAARTRRVLVAYAAAELGLAMFAWGMPRLFVRLASWVAPGWLQSAPAVHFAVRAGFALLSIAIPCLVMGATLPLLLAAPALDPRRRRAIGLVYGLNTCGATIAAGLTGFYGIAQWGISGCSRRAAACSVAAAMLAAVASVVMRRMPLSSATSESAPPLDQRVAQKPNTRPTPAVSNDLDVGASFAERLDAAPKPSETAAAATGSPFAVRLALLIAFASGFALLGAEVIWTRLLTFVFGHDTYAFATLLCVVLVGHTLGGLLYAMLARYSPRKVIVGVLSLTGVALIACFYVACALIIRGGRDPFSLGDRYLGSSSLVLEILRQWAFTPVLALLPCLLSGVTYPATVALCTEARVSSSRAMGRIGLVNGIGAALGATVTAFGLVPALGLQAVLSVLALLLALVVSALVARGAPCVASARRGDSVGTSEHDKTRSKGKRLQGTSGWLVPVGVLVCVLIAPRDLPKRVLHAVVGNHHQEFAYYEEARTATVSVIHNAINDERQLLVNAVNEVTTRLVHDQSFKLLGQLGPLLHPNPKRAVMICLGAGLAAGSALSHPLERLDVVDLLGAVKNGARYFAEENNHVLDDPRLRLHVNDGRQYLLTTRDRYDVAIVDSTHPKSVDSWILYTQEFFQLLRNRLNDGGIVVQWLPLHGLSEREFRAVVATFASVFPEMQLWASVGFETYGHVGYAKLVGQRGLAPMRIDCDRLQSRLRLARVRHDLGRYGMGQLPEILDQFIAGPARIHEWTVGSPIHHDDRPFLSYVTPLTDGRAMTPDRLMAVRESPRPYLVNAPAAGSAQDVAIGRALAAGGLVIDGQLVAASAIDPSNEKLARYIQQSQTSLPYYRELARRYPADTERQFEAATQLMTLGHVDDAALAYGAAIRLDSSSLRARLNQALVWLDSGKPKLAAERFSRLLVEKPGSTLLVRNLGVALLAQGEPGAARQQLLLAERDKPDDMGVRSSLIDAEMALGHWEAARVQLRELARVAPFDVTVPERQAKVQEQLGDVTGAHSSWAAALRLDPFRESALVGWSRHLPESECDAARSRLDNEPYRYWSSGSVALARGRALACAARWEPAAQAFVDALEADATNGDAALGLGRALGQLRRFEEALDALCLALRLGAQHNEAIAEIERLGKSTNYCTR